MTFVQLDTDSGPVALDPSSVVAVFTDSDVVTVVFARSSVTVVQTYPQVLHLLGITLEDA